MDEIEKQRAVCVIHGFNTSLKIDTLENKVFGFETARTKALADIQNMMDDIKSVTYNEYVDVIGS